MLKTVLIVLGATFGVCLLGALGFGGLVYVAATREGTPARPDDREYVVTFEDLARHVSGLEKEGGVEKFTRDDFLGSHELSYEYQLKDETLYLTSSITVDSDARSARDTYNGMSLGMKVMLATQSDEVTLEDRNDLLKCGDDSRAMMMMRGEHPVGNVFLARKGNRVFHLTLAGAWFDDPEAFAQLVKPKLEKMSAWKP
ncbi:MAG: hypothetical protein IRZ16_20745 [Myxococcaceae bacterium]|nr:hypothetical protein [Myxococcaceae bacterium]